MSYYYLPTTALQGYGRIILDILIRVTLDQFLQARSVGSNKQTNKKQDHKKSITHTYPHHLSVIDMPVLLTLSSSEPLVLVLGKERHVPNLGLDGSVIDMLRELGQHLGGREANIWDTVPCRTDGHGQDIS